ncbi:MAG: acyltransferase [Capsulimonadaceae bacterium]|nr:acyltransferase [Capsulimonadaceae bacterium]
METQSPSAPLSRTDAEAASTEGSPRKHLRFLDGVRGLAALGVVFCHIAGFSTGYAWHAGDPEWFRALTDRLIAGGHLAVDIFIVLSGYCLMRPLVRTAGAEMPIDGMLRFFKRRALRILPAYYAWLLIFATLIPIVPSLRSTARGVDEIYASTGMFNAFVAHLLLAHNLNVVWARRFDNPMWSVATEWQIYFLFPVVLLPLWRKAGPLAAIAAGYFIGYCLTCLGLERSCFWFAALFAMGMTAAAITTGPQWSAFRSAPRSPALAGITIMLLIIASVTIHCPDIHKDMIDGALSASILVYCGAFTTGFPHRLSAFFSVRPFVFLGTCSYSLYLVHYPLLQMLHGLAGGHLTNTRVAGFFALLALGLPAALALAYVSYRLIEKPFLSMRE